LRAKVEAELRRFAGITQHYPALLTTRFGLGPEHTLVEVSLFQCRTLPFLDNVSLKSEQSLTAARADNTATAHGPNTWPKYLQRCAAAFAFRFNRAQRESAAAASAKSTEIR